MQTSKKLLIAGMAIATVASAGLFMNNAIAMGGRPLDGLASTLASKYHLNKDDVKVTLDEFRQAKLTEREAEFSKELEQAVTDGKLTEDQKTKILSERTAIKTQLLTIKNMTDPAQRKTARQQLRDSIKKWASDNNIPLRWLRHAGELTTN